MVKKWGKEMFIFHAIIPTLYTFSWKFYWLKYFYIQYAWISIMKNHNSNQNGKVEKMMVLVKTFDHYHHKFHLFQLPCKIVKEFET